MNYLNLIRWKNLLMVVLVQLLIKYALLEPFGASTTLDGLGISLLILATVCIAAAGNIINDINDIETDLINKPNRVIVGKSISTPMAYNLFIGFNLVGVSLGYILSFMVEKTAFFSLFVIISILLYIYATYLKRLILIGNIVISLLVSLSLIIVGIFDIIPSLTNINQQTQWFFFKIILDYGLFAFSINFIREFVKDIEDFEGDQKVGMRTLPIVIGKKHARTLLIVLNIIITIGIIAYVFSHLYKQPIASLYFLILIIGPLLYVTLKIFSATTQSNYRQISSLLKMVMLFGMLSLLLYKFVIL